MEVSNRQRFNLLLMGQLMWLHLTFISTVLLIYFFFVTNSSNFFWAKCWGGWFCLTNQTKKIHFYKGQKNGRLTRSYSQPTSVCFFFPTDVIWVILSVEVGGLLGVTQQLSSFETEFNTQPQRNVQGDFNPFASPQKNKHDATDNSFRDPSGAWDRTQEPIQQDQNGLSHNAVNRASNGLQTNLSVVTYGQVCMNQI